MVAFKKGDHPEVRIPPPLLFFVFLIVAGAAQYVQGFGLPETMAGVRGGAAIALSLFSGYLALHAVWVIKMAGTFVDPGKPTVQIVEGGPFRISRNPMYLALVLLMAALAVLFGSVWFLLAAAVLWGVLDRFAIAPEERYLAEKFGAPYRRYKSRVRRWL